jgi:hypothetical protein
MISTNYNLVGTKVKAFFSISSISMEHTTQDKQKWLQANRPNCKIQIGMMDIEKQLRACFQSFSLETNEFTTT